MTTSMIRCMCPMRTRSRRRAMGDRDRISGEIIRPMDLMRMIPRIEPAGAVDWDMIMVIAVLRSSIDLDCQILI